MHYFSLFIKFPQISSKSIFSSRRPVFVISSVFLQWRNPLEPTDDVEQWVAVVQTTGKKSRHQTTSIWRAVWDSECDMFQLVRLRLQHMSFAAGVMDANWNISNSTCIKPRFTILAPFVNVLTTAAVIVFYILRLIFAVCIFFVTRLFNFWLAFILRMFEMLRNV